MRRALPAALVMLLTVATGWAQPDQSGAASQSSMTGAGPGSAAVPAAGIAGSVVSGITYVRAGALATALGDVVTAAGGVLTWRGAEVVATFFLGAADALVRRSQDGGADDSALSAPPLLTTAGDQNDPSDWLLPLDAVQLLGVTATPLAGQVFLGLPTGVLLAVVIGTEEAAGPTATFDPEDGTEVTTVAGVPALRFFLDDDLSLLLLDLDLAPLAFPDLTVVIDAAAARAGGDQALLALVTSLRQREWSTSLVFAQDALSLEVRSPYRFHLYLGAEAGVAPDAPVAGVILLPPTFSLYKPIAVSWGGQTATVTFRR